jgi:glycosyltransferase involved in cell wall biosynthesis
MTKKIFFNLPTDNFHTIWKELINNPIEGYEFVFPEKKFNISKTNLLKKNKIINFLYKRIFYRLISPLKLNEKFIEIPKGIDLIYSAERIIKEKIPWVCDLEAASSLAGHNFDLLGKMKKEIEYYLSSKYCKKIMPFTKFGKITLEKEFDISSFKNKIELVHFGSHIPKIEIKKNSEFVDIVFVGTSNQTDPKIFHLKGGREAIEAFRILSKKYKNLRLKIISNIPKNIDINIEGLEVLPLIGREKLFEVYAKSDIFLAPSYFGLGMTFVEALGSGLPLVCGDMFGLSEIIDKNGFIINVKNKGRYEYRGPSIDDFSNFAEFIYRNNTQEIVKQIVEYISRLVEDPKLRIKMGRESRKKYEKEFSIEVRNKKLKKIFDEATNSP